MNFRFRAAEILEQIHSDRGVEHCLALLEWEQDLDVQCYLAQAAVMSFAEEAIEPARQLVLGHDLTPDLMDVRNTLLAASMLMGIELPEAERWREDAKSDGDFMDDWYEEHGFDDEDLDEDEYDEEELDDAYDDYDYEDYDYEDDEEYDDEPIPSPHTWVREEPKIGRNDPCPCGSGKKYKKCCLKKHQEEDLS